MKIADYGIRLLALALIATTAGATAIASGLTRAPTQNSDLLVRLKDPHKKIQDTLRLPSDLQPINASEGLYHLKFRSAAESSAARETLKRDANVLRVSSNHLFRPTLHLARESWIQGASEWSSELTGGESRVTLPAVLPAPRHPRVGSDPLYTEDWAMKSIHLPYHSVVHAPVKVALIDTGIDYNHSDLRGGLWRNAQGDVGYDFAHNTQLPYDRVKFDLAGCMKDPACSSGLDQSQFLVNPGHGTHCAGHIAAVYDNALGIRGVGAGSRLMTLKFFYDAGEPDAGTGDDASAIRAIDFAIQNGAKIISASWGGRQSPDDANQSELRSAIVRAQQAGVLMIVAAGNDSIDNDNDEQPDYPSSYDLDNVISVAAVDSQDQLADFSNYGATRVHIAAPGVKVLSTTVGSHYSDSIGSYKGSDHQRHSVDWDGTSMATPIVAGAAALVWAAHPDENYLQIKDRLLRTARRLPGLQGKVSSGGILDVSAALN